MGHLMVSDYRGRPKRQKDYSTDALTGFNIIGIHENLSGDPTQHNAKGRYYVSDRKRNNCAKTIRRSSLT